MGPDDNGVKFAHKSSKLRPQSFKALHYTVWRNEAAVCFQNLTINKKIA